MSQAQVRPALASYRDKVSELTEDGASFSVIEDAVDAQPGLTQDQKAALWLFAWSLRDRSEQERQGQALRTAVQDRRYQVEVDVHSTDRPRPREFDAHGFPLPQRNRGFLERVARLLNPQ